MRLSEKGLLSFTLTEVLVVMGIFAILVFAALPQYRDYMLRAKVSNALFYLDELQDTLVKQRADLIGAGTFTYGGTDYVHSNRFQVAEDQSVWGEYYYWGPSTYNGIEMICILVNGLEGIADYQEFVVTGGDTVTNGDVGQHTRVCTRIYSNSQIFNHDCGQFPDATIDLPLEYLPTGCQCSALTTDPLGSC